MARFSTPRGTDDILPDQWPYWDFVVGHVHEVTQAHGYRRIETPVFADTSLFARTSGQGSDIVDKEMYNFRDRSGDELTLRPEGTAPVVRAYLQHGMHKLPQPVKLYYIEPMFRYDKPQQGRWREHHQFGCECIGSDDAFIDAEMIVLLGDIYRRVGLTDLSLLINSIGDAACRPAFVRDLVAYLRRQEGQLPDQDRDRLERNPLRVLDSKDVRTQEILRSAPNILDYLCPPCRAHWNKLRHGLDALGVRYDINEKLVRGLDYYTRTVFEYVPPVDGAQSTVGGGGRYDGLSEAMGGPPVPGVGFGAGVERLIMNLQRGGATPPAPRRVDAYLAHIGAGTEDEALKVAYGLRQTGLWVDMAFGALSMKAQMKRADTSGARFAVIIGEDELARNCATVRCLADGEQHVVPLDELTGVLSTDRAERQGRTSLERR